MWKSFEGSPSSKYAQLWQTLEQAAEQALPFVPSKHVKGRAQTSGTSQVFGGRVAPVRVGRRGDFQPQFHGASVRHAQWVRQVRRLQAYLRSVQAHGAECQYAQDVWMSIVTAKGFLGGFRSWWFECKSKPFGVPGVLPWSAPECEIARGLFETMVVEVRSLEAKLKSTSRQHARLRRAKNPNVLFKDLKDSPANGVDFLLKPLQSRVVAVNEDASLTLEPPQPWVTDAPIFSNGKQLVLIHVEPDCLWVDLDSCVPVGSLVSQLKSTGTKHALEQAFLSEWRLRWDRHKDVPDERWETILSFARRHLPRRRLEWPALTTDSLMQVIGRKKPGSSSGLDGVSLVDLKCMPSEAHEAFVHMFSEAETTGIWPDQLLIGKVACLAKKERPQDVLDYRPITILGLLYRCWGSYHARHAIRQLEMVLPDTLYGSRPSRFAGQVWCQLLWAVEDSLSSGVALSGVFADIQKAFNCLPRLVVLEVAALLGIPFSLLVAWAGALAQLGRRFQIGSNLSSAAYSVTGLPEGDGLSCLGMVIVDMLFHLWHGFFFPMAQPISHVDDWTLLTTNPAFVARSVQCLRRFTDALDLQLDMKKTCAWSVCASGRRLLKSQGFAVVQGCRMLGAHVQTTRKHTNSTQMDRINAASGICARLRLSASAYKHKIRAIRTAAWPRCLHAISATTIALQAYGTLHSGAMRGLGADGAGCNSLLHLGLIEKPTTDPQFWAIVQTLRMVRDCGIADVVTSVLGGLAHGEISGVVNGISSTLLTRVQALGWHINDDHRLCDSFGAFALFEVSMEEILWRMEYAWLRVVGAAVSHRPGLVDLDQVDPRRTRLLLSTLSTSDQACYRKLLNGAHITQECMHYCQESDSDVCLFCQCTDSRYHRFWLCPAFDDCRTEVSPELFAAVPSLPECVTAYGWALKPSTFDEWYQYFGSLDSPMMPRHLPPGDKVGHVFTDGSCANPHYPDLRFASWAIVVADPSQQCNADILDSGVLPGVRQTSVRAELFAVSRAIRIATLSGVSLHIWCDCQAVVGRLQRLMQGGKVRINSPNADLWLMIENDLMSVPHGRVGITKVLAHRSVSTASTALEEWCFQHNQFSTML